MRRIAGLLGVCAVGAILVLGLARVGLHGQSPDQLRFYPMAVWYGGGKARAPLLERVAACREEAGPPHGQPVEALGCCAVRAWCGGVSGPRAGEAYGRAGLAVLLERAEEGGRELGLQVSMGWAPAGIGRKDPSWR